MSGPGPMMSTRCRAMRGADRHVLVLLAGKVDDAQAQAIVDSLALKK